MPDTVQIITDLLQERFPDVLTSQAEAYINRVHRELCGHIPEISRTAENIPVIADQGSYNLPVDTLEIAHVLYIMDGSAYQLLRTSQDEMGEKKPLWGFDPSGIPSLFYTQNRVNPSGTTELLLFVHPRPALSTGAVYPYLRVYITQPATMTGSDPLPDGLASYMVYLEGASYYAAQALRGAEAALPFLQLYQQQIEFNRDRWRRRMPQVPSDSTYPLNRRK